MRLTDEQIEQAAKTIYDNLNINAGLRWPDSHAHVTAQYRTLAFTVAQFLQAPWEPITDHEFIVTSRGNTTFLDAVNRLIEMRNAKLVYKPVDPRIEIVRRIITNDPIHLPPRSLTEVIKEVLAALDASK